jgi:hypothetical protein
MRTQRLLAELSCSVGLVLGTSLLGSGQPVINSVVRQGDQIVVRVHLPSGFRHVVLEERSSPQGLGSLPLVAGELNGTESVATFQVPLESSARFLTLRVGPELEVPGSTYSGPAHLAVTALSDLPLSEVEKIGHVLNRVAYGPSVADRARVENIGVSAYLEGQLQPSSIDESANTDWLGREAGLFVLYQPHVDTPIVEVGTTWRYAKGTQAPPAGWTAAAFDDSLWMEGPSGFGYGDNDDETVLDDMRQTDTQLGYLSVFLRHVFTVPDLAAVDQLILQVDFDDGYVAYLNGVEVARENLSGSPPAFDASTTDSHEAGTPVNYDLTAQKALLVEGANVLAIQAHNYNPTSSDLSMIPALLNRSLLPEPPVSRIRGIDELQHLIHLRGVYSRRQLQAVLGEFWENHFTTDYDKLEDYFDDLRNSDARDAMPDDQAEREAAQTEFEEYQFFYDNALGHFGDLLLYSATSPAMLVYLDNVLNRKGEPNENYAREILELSAFGVDNRYTQADIEELARCFTGWSVRKVWPSQRPAFPASARTPLTDESVQFDDHVLLDLGSGWAYFKGLAEPSSDVNGDPTLAWTELGFDDSTWFSGATGIGYGDDDDTTVLSDMRYNYSSAYLRHTFTLSRPEDVENLLLGVRYDDGFVAYVNGVEVGRSRTMEGTGEPPPYDAFARGGHEASLDEEMFSLTPAVLTLRFAPEVNVLAIQVHNISLTSSDLSILPRLVQRRLLPGSIENGDPNGAWVFRFNPDEHDTEAKTLFPGTGYEIDVPAGRTGVDGVNDAIDVIDAMASHPSTREFICLKLINRFVSDEIDLVSYRNGTAPEGLRTLLDDAQMAWMSTTSPGHIETVLRTILRPQTQDGYFWSQSAYRAKVKTPVEFVNASLRALNTAVAGTSLPQVNGDLGMDLFIRDDPDGWSELGFDWMDTGTLLERVKFLQRLAGNLDRDLPWDVNAWTASLTDSTADGIIDHFDELLYDGHLTTDQRDLLVRFASTDDLGDPLPFEPARSDYSRRVQELVSLILAMPQGHQQ